MKRKLGILALAVFFILTSAVTGTLANAAEVTATENTVTSGENVIIEQGVYARGFDLTSFFVFDGIEGVKEIDCGPLHVAVYDDEFSWELTHTENCGCESLGQNLWCNKEISNAKDQIVVVKNSGTENVYVRTVFAFEADTTEFNGDLIHLNKNTTNITWESIGQATIEGKLYDLHVATYQDVLATGQTSAPSLLQIAMDKNAENPQMSQFGDIYEIMYVSQAVETGSLSGKNLENAAQEALNNAFGKISTTNHPWIPQTTAGN